MMRGHACCMGLLPKRGTPWGNFLQVIWCLFDQIQLMSALLVTFGTFLIFFLMHMVTFNVNIQKNTFVLQWSLGIKFCWFTSWSFLTNLSLISQRTMIMFLYNSQSLIDTLWIKSKSLHQDFFKINNDKYPHKN